MVNFRGLIYSPINEQGVVFLFGRILDDLNMYIEEVRVKYPDCVARRYTGKGWERVYIEFEYQSSNFITHKHKPEECNMIVCWVDDLNETDKKKLEGIEIIELKSLILELPNKKIKEPSKITEKGEYDLQHHFKRKNVSKPIQQLYEKLDKVIKAINVEIWRKYSKTSITYYSPEKVFVYVVIRKTSIMLDIYTNTKELFGVKNFKGHENWGKAILNEEEDLNKIIPSIKESYVIIKEAIKNNVNTGWYSLSDKHDETEEEEGGDIEDEVSIVSGMTLIHPPEEND